MVSFILLYCSSIHSLYFSNWFYMQVRYMSLMLSYYSSMFAIKIYVYKF